MAKVSFTTTEGELKSYKLVNHRPVRIGRDPANDIVLRDAKVSRSHAEVVFERGFYVLHDLGSANGSFVNGTKIRVAPLTDGAELKFGNSYATFSEELPDSPSHTVAVANPSRESGELAAAPAEEATPEPPSVPPSADPPPAQSTEDDIGTAPHPGLRGEPPRHSERATLIDEEQPRSAAESHFRIPWSAQERLAVIDGAGAPLMHFRRPPIIVTLFANVLAAIVALTGIAVALFLGSEKIVFPAILALAVTAIFTLLIVALAPRKHLVLYGDENLTSRSLLIRQDRGLPLPRIRFRAFESSGSEIASYERHRFRPLMRRMWRIALPAPHLSGAARERHWSHVVLRLLTGNFVAAYRPQYDILLSQAGSAAVEREGETTALRLSGWRGDYRVPLAFAVIVAALDR